MKCIALALSVAAFIAGMIAAWLWWKASRVQAELINTATTTEPELDALYTYVNFANQNSAFAESGRLNRLAAIWTAVAVVLGTAANLAGQLPATSACPL